jgi:hypothetical protein
MAVSAGRAPTPWATRTRAVIVRWRRWIWLVLGLAGLLLAARAVAGSRAELFAGIRSLRQVSWTWLGVAAVAEGASFTGWPSPSGACSAQAASAWAWGPSPGWP